MHLSSEILRHRGEIARAIRSRKYEVNQDGNILIPSMGAFLGGVMTSWVNGRDQQIHANLFTTEGRNHTLLVLVTGAAVISPWYCAPFGNSTPLATWTGANFTANALEIDDYDEATREVFTEGTPASGSVDNSASKAEFTMNATVTAYGCGLLEASAKNAVTGKCLAASLFASPRALVATDVLTVQYTLSLTSS
jgi:hypothetical protein